MILHVVQNRVRRWLTPSHSYFLSCLSSSFLTHHLGLRYSLHLAALSLSSGCLLLSFAPPFGAFIAAVALMGFGGGLYDAAITTVISHEEDGALMSYTYAFFGGALTAFPAQFFSLHRASERRRTRRLTICSLSTVGATFSPLIIGSFVDKGYPWNVSRPASTLEPSTTSQS
jgi:MFS family permease